MIRKCYEAVLMQLVIFAKNSKIIYKKRRPDMNLNNYYNFRNPIRHFIKIDHLNYPSDINSFDPIEELSWTKPFSFRIYKADDKYRTVKIPNVLNFVRAYHYYSSLPYFNNVQNLDPIHKRLAANIDTGDFVSGNYNKQLDQDFMLLCNYDVLVKLDISEYYGRIYTHYLGWDSNGLKDAPLAWLNNGRTSGLLMGNYLSLYFAEYLSSCISKELQENIDTEEINCTFNYFSDDFYFFCNENDIQKILSMFDKTLAEFDFVRKDKKNVWTYETYNTYNLLTRYWKATIRAWNLDVLKDYENKKKHPNVELYHKYSFLNQLIYRISELPDEKTKRSFITNFFKTKHFQTNNFSMYRIFPYDLHQLFFLIKKAPESLLYVAHIINSISDIRDKAETEVFMKARYEESLKKELHDVQLYFYYAISVLGYSGIVNSTADLVIQSENQVLIAYYLKDGIFNDAQISALKLIEAEEYWFQNYHLLLYIPSLRIDLNANIRKYLIPKKLITHVNAVREHKYYSFYYRNLQNGKALINNIADVTNNICQYLNMRYEETATEFDEEEEIDNDIENIFI